MTMFAASLAAAAADTSTNLEGKKGEGREHQIDDKWREPQPRRKKVSVFFSLASVVAIVCWLVLLVDCAQIPFDWWCTDGVSFSSFSSWSFSVPSLAVLWHSFKAEMPACLLFHQWTNGKEQHCYQWDGRDSAHSLSQSVSVSLASHRSIGLITRSTIAASWAKKRVGMFAFD